MWPLLYQDHCWFLLLTFFSHHSDNLLQLQLSHKFKFISSYCYFVSHICNFIFHSLTNISQKTRFWDFFLVIAIFIIIVTIVTIVTKILISCISCKCDFLTCETNSGSCDLISHSGMYFTLVTLFSHNCNSISPKFWYYFL